MGKAIAKPCAHHRETLPTDYVACAVEAERRLARGDMQRKCPTCGLWIFESDFGSNRGAGA